MPAYTVDRPPTWDVGRESYVDLGDGTPQPSWSEALDGQAAEPTPPAYVAQLGGIDARGIAEGSRDAERTIRYVTSANWLLYGIQPEGAKAGLIPGRCPAKVHQRATLGFTGWRVLVPRQWSTRTLADVRADNRAWVRAIVAGTVDGHQQDAAGAIPDPADGPNRYRFELARPGSPGVRPVEHRILRAISQHRLARRTRRRPPTTR
jgi:replication initiator protein RepSA